MEEIINLAVSDLPLIIQLFIGLTITRIIYTIVRIMARPNFIPSEEKEQIKDEKVNIDKDLEKYFNYKE